MDLQKVKYALDEFERTESGHIDIINEARKQLAELEKPDEDASQLLEDTRAYCDGWCIEDEDALKRIQQYAESYHAKKCAECIGSLPAFPHKDERYPRFEKRSGITTDVDYNPAEMPDAENRTE